MPEEIQLVRSALLAGGSVETIDPEVLEFAESELVEEYLESSLSSAESELFHKNFLVTEERRDLVNELRLLKKVSSGPFAFDASQFEKPAEEPPAQTPRTSTILIVLAIAAILIVVAWRIL